MEGTSGKILSLIIDYLNSDDVSCEYLFLFCYFIFYYFDCSRYHSIALPVSRSTSAHSPLPAALGENVVPADANRPPRVSVAPSLAVLPSAHCFWREPPAVAA